MKSVRIISTSNNKSIYLKDYSSASRYHFTSNDVVVTSGSYKKSVIPNFSPLYNDDGLVILFDMEKNSQDKFVDICLFLRVYVYTILERENN